VRDPAYTGPETRPSITNVVVLGASVYAGQKGIDPLTLDLAIYFNRTMKSSTMVPGTFRVIPSDHTNEPTITDVKVTDDGTVAHLGLAAPLSGGRTYTLLVKTDAQSLAGIALAQEWSIDGIEMAA
jgi:hypothetical protein